MQGEFPEGVAALLARDMRGGVAGGENKTGKWCSESESEMSTRLTAADSVHVECVGAFDRGGRESCPFFGHFKVKPPRK